MTVPPRWQVLVEADEIVENCLRGNAADQELRQLINWLRLREQQQATVAQIKGSWERTKMSPFFKLWCFYVALFMLSICANLIQKKLEKRHNL